MIYLCCSLDKKTIKLELICFMKIQLREQIQENWFVNFQKMNNTEAKISQSIELKAVLHMKLTYYRHRPRPTNQVLMLSSESTFI